MSRLASFKGPSAPSQSPIRAQPPSNPSSPSRPTESTFHRKARTLLREIDNVAQTWDELVLIDGMRAAQSLVDTRTELDNELTTLPTGSLPPVGTVYLRIQLMEKRLADLNALLSKLQKQFDKMVNLVDGMEAMVFEAHKTKGWKWVHEEPLWCTWTLEKFATELPSILPAYQHEMVELTELVDGLRSHDTPFERSRDILAKWVAQPHTRTQGWSEWEDLCSVEVERWDSNK
ncbi:hypothetical protein M422DRAFT_60062 [Sphaerobolus stellatus SS14]|uniref:Uncharacterized protein n=1 Tax=Sphaerobolus stellatus (strain SS14) TaxID=990650 RepID=A0A0C9VB50_SPHS4|nr:hypothetical protein M422DRAFT_60062 [Sphaerobolus stellatus SS14]